MIDDVPTLFDNLQAAQLLMAAIGGDPGQPRRVSADELLSVPVTRAGTKASEHEGVRELHARG